MYEELRALVRLYFEIKYDDGTLYSEDEWEDAFDEVELEVCMMVGLIDGEEVE
jgi:hypothetical protein